MAALIVAAMIIDGLYTQSIHPPRMGSLGNKTNERSRNGKSQHVRKREENLTAFLLCFFFGMFGIHRFYVGKIGTGILQIITLGGLGLWALIDFILIIIGGFSDKEGRKLTQWT